MRLWKLCLVDCLAGAVLCVRSVGLNAAEAPKIPGAGGSAQHESAIEGTLEKYDPVLNKLTIKGTDEEQTVLDAVQSLKAKDGSRRVPMATVKQGQKIRVIYAEKNKKKIAKDVEIVKNEEEAAPSKKEKGGKSETTTPKIPGAP